MNIFRGFLPGDNSSCKNQEAAVLYLVRSIKKVMTISVNRMMMTLKTRLGLEADRALTFCSSLVVILCLIFIALEVSRKTESEPIEREQLTTFWYLLERWSVWKWFCDWQSKTVIDDTYFSPPPPPDGCYSSLNHFSGASDTWSLSPRNCPQQNLRRICLMSTQMRPV